jgi:VWFA-related protein
VSTHGQQSGWCGPYLAALASLGLAAAQSIAPDEMHARTVPYVPPSPVTLRTQVDLVEVPVVVRDGRRAVAGLTRDDFEIYDSGKKQAIIAFSVQNFQSRSEAAGGAKRAPAAAESEAASPRPRFLALLFDDLYTDQFALKPAKDAAIRFVKTGLAPGDRAAVFTTAESRDSEFTADVPKLLEQIAKITHRKAADDSAGMCPVISPYEAYLIANQLDKGVLGAKLAECFICNGRNPCPEGQVTSMAGSIWEHARMKTGSTLQAIDELVDGMARLPGQRMILLTSAGLLTGNRENDFDRLMAKALHAEVVIDTLDAKRLYVVGADVSTSKNLVPVPTQMANVEAENDGLAALAAGTGGTFYHNNNDLGQGFRQLGILPETLYILGFVPAAAADGSFHRLKVRLTAGKRYSLEARLGYTGPSADAAAQVSPLSKLDREMMATGTLADLPASFTWEHSAGQPGITVVAHLDVGRMRFLSWHGRRAQRLMIVAVLLDSRGSFVTGKRSELDLNLTQATFAQLTKTSFTASMTLKAPPGSYSVRAVVEDGLDGKLAAADGSVKVQ